MLGFVALHVLPRFEHDDRIVRILALVVDPGVRERGVGRLLMGEAERVGKDVGAAFVEITAGHHRPEAPSVRSHRVRPECHGLSPQASRLEPPSPHRAPHTELGSP